MGVICNYYTNNARLANEIAEYIHEPGFRLYCLQGSVIVDRNKVKIVSKCATALISFIPEGSRNVTVILLTSDYKHVEFAGREVEVSQFYTKETYYTLCTFLMSKYCTTSNVFTIEFGHPQGTAVISPIKDNGNKDALMSCTILSQVGNILVSNEEAIKAILEESSGPKAFSFTSTSTDLEKTVSVKKSYGEIYREVAKYLNKTVVLVSSTEKFGLLEQYISSIGFLECTTNSKGQRVYKKVPASSLIKTCPMCIQLISTTIDEVAREQGRLLRRV